MDLSMNTSDWLDVVDIDDAAIRMLTAMLAGEPLVG
jgi:hypothetical protein